MLKKLFLLLFILASSNAFAGVVFDGTDDFVGVGTMGNFGTGLDSNHFCISQYLKSSVTGTAMATWGHLNTGSTTALRVYVNLSPTDGTTTSAGKLYVYRRGEDGAVRAGGVNTNTGITDGNWHNLIVCLSPNATPTIYIDGISQTITNLTTANANNLANFGFQPYIGAYNNRGTIGNPFSGTITETAVWSSTALPSAGDVTLLNTHTRGNPLLVTTLNGLGGYWKMNEGTSGSADAASITDYSGNTNTATADNGANNTGLTWSDDLDLFGSTNPKNTIIRNGIIRGGSTF
jgi:hypothetical protein